MKTIAVAHDITRNDFYNLYVKKGIPVVIKGVINKWEAVEKWNLNYFSAIDLDVKVKKGNVAEGSRDNISLKAYCKLLNDHQSKEENLPSHIPYLHDVPIFELAPELLKDIDSFPLKYFPKWYWNKWWQYVQFFMGGENSLTPLHFDTLYTHNLFFQIAGKKKFILIPSNHQKFCYLYNWRWSPVDPTNINHANYPLFKNAECSEVVVEEGDILYIPPGMLHQVHGLSFSISFNIDWHTSKSVTKGLLSFKKGAPISNIHYNFLIALGIIFRVPSKIIFPYYKSYLNYVS